MEDKPDQRIEVQFKLIKDQFPYYDQDGHHVETREEIRFLFYKQDPKYKQLWIPDVKPIKLDVAILDYPTEDYKWVSIQENE